jgi:hypothetical protein
LSEGTRRKRRPGKVAKYGRGGGGEWKGRNDEWEEEGNREGNKRKWSDVKEGGRKRKAFE